MNVNHAVWRVKLPLDSLKVHPPKVKHENAANDRINRKKKNSHFMFLSFTPTHPRKVRTRVYARGGGERVKPEPPMVPSRPNLTGEACGNRRHCQQSLFCVSEPRGVAWHGSEGTGTAGFGKAWHGGWRDQLPPGAFSCSQETR